MTVLSGSEDAFNDFQNIRMSSGDVSSKTEQAFRDIVNGCSDDSVGGQVIEITFNHKDNSFVYNWKRGFFTSKDQIVALGEPIEFFNNATDGGYSFEINQINIGNVVYDIDQMEPAILYSREYRINTEDADNPNLTGLMMPILVVINENGEAFLYRR